MICLPNFFCSDLLCCYICKSPAACLSKSLSSLHCLCSITLWWNKLKTLEVNVSSSCPCPSHQMFKANFCPYSLSLLPTSLFVFPAVSLCACWTRSFLIRPSSSSGRRLSLYVRYLREGKAHLMNLHKQCWIQTCVVIQEAPFVARVSFFHLLFQGCFFVASFWHTWPSTFCIFICFSYAFIVLFPSVPGFHLSFWCS